MVFKVKGEKFEGPLDLLLTLIERRQFHINDVALAKVTDDFLDYARSFPDFPISESAQFAFIASTLLLIKSKALLPALALTPEEESSVEELERRLIQHKRFKELSLHIRSIFCRTPLFQPKEREVVPTFSPPKNMSAPLLLFAIRGVLATLPKMERLSRVAVKKVLSLEEMVTSLTERIKKTLRMNFTEFSRAHRGDRINVLVGFLAMLELVRRGIIAVAQDEAFGEITMETEEIETPRY